MDILKAEGLVKGFGGRRVIDGLSFAVPEHSVFGFLGQNGAGKTTTMKMALGLLRPEEGKILICGERVAYGQTKTNRYVGYLPDVPEFYGYLRPMEYLRLCGQITGMAPKEIRQKSEELLGLVGLSGVHKKIGGFSRGMKQRLGIAQALLNSPRLLICDEPTSALDPIGRKEILDILFQVKGKTTVVFSTHILSDVERICDHVALLHQGKLALSGSLSDIKRQHKQDGLFVEFPDAQSRKRFTDDGSLSAFGRELAPDGRSVTLHGQKLPELETAALNAIAGNRLLPLRFEVLEPTLESLFLEAVQ